MTREELITLARQNGWDHTARSATTDVFSHAEHIITVTVAWQKGHLAAAKRMKDGELTNFCSIGPEGTVTDWIETPVATLAASRPGSDDA